jgi:hypothetical protein
VKIKYQNKVTGENWDGNEFRGEHTIGWRSQYGARATWWCGASGLRFQLISSCDFSYLIKITKVLTEKFKANLSD